MTLEIQSTAPANASFDYASTKYTATVGNDGDAGFVYGYSRNFYWTSARMGLTAGDALEAHWLKFGADVTTSVAITKISGPISTFDIYPRGVVTSATLDADGDGILLLEIPTNTRLRIEIDGDEAEPLHIFAEPLKSTIPGTRTDWTSLRMDVSSVDGSADTITFASAHGMTTGDRIVFQQDAGQAATILTGNGLTPYQVYTVDVVNSTTLGLLTVDGDPVDLSIGGSTLFYGAPAEWTDTVNSLYFPDGVHVIGKMFPLAADVEVYLERGAVLIGGFDLRRKDGIVVRGPGTISGEHTTFEADQTKSLAERLENAFFNGYPEDDFVTTNTLAEVTMFAGAHFSVVTCFHSITNIQLLSFWTPNTDGLIGLKNTTTSTITITDCFVFSGDDCIHLNAPATVNVSGCFVVGVGASCMHLGYKATQGFNASQSVNVSDCDIMALSPDFSTAYGFPSGFPIRAHLDGVQSQTSLGYYNVNFTDIRIWGQIDTEAISLWNVQDPWVATAQQGDRYGQLAFWTLTNVAVELEPAYRSRIWGRDALNTPHDIEFENFFVAGTRVDSSNFETYFNVNEYPYDISWDAIIIPPTGGGEPGSGSGGERPSDNTPAVALWTAVLADYDTDGLVTLTNIRDRSATSVSTTVGQAAAQAVINLWPMYAQEAYDRTDAIHVEVAEMAVIAMLWRRGGSSQSVAKIEWDEVFGTDGLISKVRRTGARGRRGPLTNSGVGVLSELSGGRTVLGWSDPNGLPFGLLPTRRTSR